MEWISVKEKMPELNTSVLVFFISEFSGNPLIRVDYTLQYHNNDIEWGYTDNGVITHWMPLPEPPKQ